MMDGLSARPGPTSGEPAHVNRSALTAQRSSEQGGRGACTKGQALECLDFED